MTSRVSKNNLKIINAMREEGLTDDDIYDFAKDFYAYVISMCVVKQLDEEEEEEETDDDDDEDYEPPPQKKSKYTKDEKGFYSLK
jgi:preprotein translocase subunit SecA